MRTLYIVIAMLTIFSSCKKEDETVDLCTNGFLDPGESSPDCGGNCPPCAVVSQEYFTVVLNGEPIVMTFHELIYSGTAWSLQMANDSISMQISLGTSGAIQTSSITNAGTYCSLNGIDYPIQQNGIYSISDHDLSNQIMSGFFHIDFLYQITASPNTYATLSFTGGQFDNFSY